MISKEIGHRPALPGRSVMGKTINKIILILILLIMIACPAYSSLYWRQTNGPYGGYGYSLGISKTHPNVIYLGTKGAGIHKSVNAGTTWEAKNYGLDHFSYIVRAIEVNPTNSNEVYAIQTDGIFKTIDGGENWASVTNDMGTAQLSDLAIDPINHSIIYVTTIGENLKKSINGGASWETVSMPTGVDSVTCIDVVSSGANSIIYAGTYGFGIYKSNNGGQDWINISSSEAELDSSRIFNIAASPSSPESVVYTSSYFSSWKLKKTVDAGATWETMVFYSNNNEFPFIARDIIISPSSPEVAYIATEHYYLYKSFYDSVSSRWEWVQKRPDEMDDDYWDIALCPTDESIVYAVGYGRGFYVSTDEAQTWTFKNNNLNNVWVRSLLTVPSSEGTIIFAGTQNLGIYRSINSGESWEQIIDGIDYYSANFDSLVYNQEDSILYAGGYDKAYRSYNLGGTWETILNNPSINHVNALAIDPISKEVIYANVQSSGKIYRSLDYGDTWATWNTGINELALTAVNNIFSASYEGRSYLYVACGNQEGIYQRFTDSPSWEQVNGGLGGFVGFNRAVFSLDYSSLEGVYLGYGQILWYKTAEANSWTPLMGVLVGSNRYMYDLQTYASDPSIIYAYAHNREIWKIYDYGASKVRENTGLETYSYYYGNKVLGLDKNVDPLVLYADVGGRSVWKSEIASGEIPYSPSNIVGTALSTNEIYWSWADNSYNEDGFRLFTLLDSLEGETEKNIITTIEAGLLPNTGYQRYIEAYNIYGDSMSNNSSVFYTLAQTPEAPYLDDLGTDFISITWEANGNPSGTNYIIESSTVEEGSVLPIYWQDAGSSILYPPEFDHQFLEPETIYYYRVRAENGNGIETLPGPETWFKTATPEPSLDVVSPEITYVRFNDRLHFNGAYGEGDIIYHTPIVSAIITDYGSTEFPSIITPEGVDISSVNIRFDTYLFDVSEESFSLSSTESIPITPESDTTVVYMNFEIPGRLGDTTYICTIEAQDKAEPWYSKGTWDGKVRVIGDGGAVIGDPLCFPTPYKPLTDPSVRISYTLSTNSDVTIYMYDISGQIVLTKKFISGFPGGQAGYNDFVWDGQTDFGKIIANGIYVIKIISKGKSIGTGKLIVHD